MKPPPGSPDAPPPQAAPGAPPQPGGAPPNPQAAPPPPPKPAAPLAASLRAYSLKSKSPARMPEDFSLGPLQSSRPEGADEAEALKTAKKFMDGVASGKLDKACLLPEGRDALAILLAPAKPIAGSSPYRLGAIIIDGEDASLRVRLPTPPEAAREEGLLSMRKVGDSWYIEALSLDPPASGALAFDPGQRIGAQ